MVAVAKTFPEPTCLSDPNTHNEIACENTARGSPPSSWEIVGAGDPSIQGYARPFSVNHGSVVHFRVKTDAPQFHLDIYRLGYYGGAGARLVATVIPNSSLSQHQPTCQLDVPTRLLDCGNWRDSATWSIPRRAVSGVYVAKVVRDSGPRGASHVIFVVRDDESRADLGFQTSDMTWEAYNTYGGYGMYRPTGKPPHQSYRASYHRPFATRGLAGGRNWFFNAEYPMVRFLEANGYDTTYFTGLDTARSLAALRRHKVFLSVGHDEYWSHAQRANVEAARNARVNLAFFSGNEIFWKARWEHAGTWLTSYKESLSGLSPTTHRLDPTGVWTGLWRDPRFRPPADGGHPENALTGTLYTSESTGSITVTSEEGKDRFWRHTSIAALPSGHVATLPFGTLGYEWDEDVDTGAIDDLLRIPVDGTRFRPAGLLRLSTTQPPISTQALNHERFQRFVPKGATHYVGPRRIAATHHMTLYRARSGALVFSAGTVQWSWGLDSHHDGGQVAADPRMQQATVNLLADMGVQPARLFAGLARASASTDTTAPITALAEPTNGATVHVGYWVRIRGTAEDAGGGIVAAVEVSTDGGATWSPAVGTTQWSFDWLPTTRGIRRILVRSADDSANLERTLRGVSVIVR